MTLHIGFPPGRSYLSRRDDGAVVLRPGLKIFIETGIDPVLIIRNSYLTIVWGNGLGNTAKVSKRIVIDPDPAADIASGHPFNVEKIAVG